MADAVLFQANAELDDEGNPYYVGSYGHYKYGRKAQVVDGVHVPTEWNQSTSVEGLSVNSKKVNGVIDAAGKMKWYITKLQAI